VKKPTIQLREPRDKPSQALLLIMGIVIRAPGYIPTLTPAKALANIRVEGSEAKT
jgi:hypothetical protein